MPQLTGGFKVYYNRKIAKNATYLALRGRPWGNRPDHYIFLKNSYQADLKSLLTWWWRWWARNAMIYDIWYNLGQMAFQEAQSPTPCLFWVWHLKTVRDITNKMWVCELQFPGRHPSLCTVHDFSQIRSAISKEMRPKPTDKQQT